MVATAHKVFDDDGLFAGVCLLNVDRDVAADASALVISAIDVLEESGCDGQCHIALDICFVGTSAHIQYLRVGSGTSRYDYVDIASDVCLTAGTIEFGDSERTGTLL